MKTNVNQLQGRINNIYRLIMKIVTYVFDNTPKHEKIKAKEKIKKLLEKRVNPMYLSGWYFREHIDYISENVDNIKSPVKFVADGGGDCDDFTEFAYYILTKKGYKCQRLYLMSDSGKENHVVLVAKAHNSEYYIMDNMTCFSRIKSEQDVCEYFSQDGYNKYILI